MASFAELDTNNTVLRVIKIHDNELLKDGVEDEQTGINFCKSLYGQNTIWKQTSFNTLAKKYYYINSEGVRSLHTDQSKVFRKQYAMVGGKWDATKDGFIPEQPFESWTFDEINWTWLPPVDHPHDSNPNIPFDYDWNEDTLTWDPIGDIIFYTDSEGERVYHPTELDNANALQYEWNSVELRWDLITS